MRAVGDKIRLLREQQGLSQRGLADAAGISAPALSQIESGQTSPSVATLEKLADGLGIAMAAFFLDEGENRDVELVNLADRPAVAIARGGHFVPLTSRKQPAGFEPMLVRLAPNGAFEEEKYGIQSARVFVWIRRGEAILEYGAQTYRLHETQSVYYDARKPHNWRNASDAACELLMVRSR
ncbi:MAG: helix-turn-helix domain-containing protein [Zetaproteobacteria bacterium]|nr:MAG: helix-turn-helix domain-containing protein [Zetaproteobacteria bacterium]